jgi:hypothetical protein
VNRKTAAAAFIVLAAAALCLVLLRQRPGASRSTQVPWASPSAGTDPASASGRALAAAAAGPRRPVKLDPARFAQLRSAIELARKQRGDGAPGTTISGAPAAPVQGPDARQDYPRGRSGDVREYLQQQVRELLPLLESCRQIATRETPGLKGELRVQFTVEAAPELGGHITESEIPEGGLSTNARLSECVRESVYAIQLEPPEEGMKIVVTHPFTFGDEGVGMVMEKSRR